jgi:predicted 2-oxoglutarate/Fe(II)-dependent dioxygenase YbiX
MNKLENYIKIYSALDKEFCNKIRNEVETVKWDQHLFYNSKGEYVNRSGNKELDVSWDEIPSKPELTQKVWNTIYKYVLEDFKNSYFAGWKGFTNIRFNRYHVDKLMALHCDHIHSMFDGERKGIPILSVLGLLNDDFKGGEFLMFDNEVKIELKQGDIIIFPSIFLYPHRVAPVTEGIRDSFVSWVF